MKIDLADYIKGLDKKLYLLAAVVMLVGIVMPALQGGNVSALTLTSRSLSLDKNTASATGTIYSFSVKAATSANVGSVEVDLCDSTSGQGPLLGTTCTAPAGLAFSGATLTGMAPAGGTPVLSGAATGQTPQATLGTGSTAARIRIAYTTPQALTAGVTVVSFNITGITNPSAAGTFFARIGLFSDTAWTTATDNGAMANSIQGLQNVSFKIQETLSFCVGAMPNGTVAYAPATFAAATLTTACGQAAGTNNVALGIAPNTTTACISPASAHTATCADGSTTDDDNYGYAMISTNAANGATVNYRPNDNGTTYTQETLQTSGATGCTFTVRTDNCINPVNEDASAAVGAVMPFLTTSTTEQLGMSVPAKNNTTRATNVLARETSATGYGFTGEVTGGTACSTGLSAAQDCWNWHRTGSGLLASSTASAPAGAIDWEAIEIFFATKPALTTPSGQYAVNVEYFSVPTY